jgi:hypothetical protein
MNPSIDINTVSAKLSSAATDLGVTSGEFNRHFSDLTNLIRVITEVTFLSDIAISLSEQSSDLPKILERILKIAATLVEFHSKGGILRSDNVAPLCIELAQLSVTLNRLSHQLNKGGVLNLIFLDYRGRAWNLLKISSNISKSCSDLLKISSDLADQAFHLCGMFPLPLS